MDLENGTVRYEEEYITNPRGLKLFTCRWLPVNEEPKALIFICHGYAMECSITMNSTAIRLVKAGYAVYGIDYEGHGKSSGLQGYISTFDNVVNDCSNFFTDICEKKENKKKMRYLLGESMGGAVLLLVHRKKPDYWDGAVLVAPMCKVADDMKPHPLVISILRQLNKFIPKWRIVPVQDVVDAAFRQPEIRAQVRANPYCYKGRPRLNTANELLNTSLDLEQRLHEIKQSANSCTMFHEIRNKNFKLYPGMWHGLLYGETPENIAIVLRYHRLVGSENRIWKFEVKPDENVNYQEEFITNSHGLKLFTCKWVPKRDEPKALIFICHGYAMECSITMSSTAMRLVKEGYAVYGMDYQGHGKSSGLHGYIEDFDSIVHDCSAHFSSICEIEENKGKMRYLVGESMGGAVALLLHKKMPDYWHGAVLVAPMCKVRKNEYCYKGPPRLKSAYELLRVSTDIERSLQEVTIPFIVLHGEDDKVTAPHVSKELYMVASTKDKTMKLYPGMWHGLLYGEPLENIDIVFADIIKWLDERTKHGNSRPEVLKKVENDHMSLNKNNKL
ncbi:Ribosomal L29 family protein [Hibiscus syriacus]|uniref:Ribosomal L29 family protein n=1 Tax=Hibiscus syriacus TaxID=106335 RepID=A0A6A2Y9J8_HIBSY|nr:Ribosomal L29 family protein [Hibiscus syriacus]